MPKRDTSPNKLLIIFCLLITGIGIGWLIGLSVSPVVSIVITAVTGSAAAIIAALSGLEDKPDEGKEANNRQKSPVLRWNVDPLPLMMLVIGILLGSLIGIKARNDSWLGSDLSIEVKKWSDAGLVDAGFPKEALVRRLFESRYYTNTTTISTGLVQGNNPLGTILFSSSTSECERLIAASTKARLNADQSLADALRGSTVMQLRDLPALITDTLTLANVVEEVICADGSPQP